MPASETNSSPSRREQNKADKLRRIREAAHELFVTDGFDDTTLRQIAARADVGFGTLFRYASSKRDLLFLVVTDDLREMNRHAFENAPADVPLLDQLMYIWQIFYTFFDAQPELARLTLRELHFYAEGAQARKFYQVREALMLRLTEVVTAARQHGEINTTTSDSRIARAIFDIYSAEVRLWIGEKDRSIASGMVELRQLLRLLVTGIGHAMPESDAGTACTP
ncbi:helix-turn-helix domain-containing protein [Burkholderia gladioli pv. gladioli]|nr:TetR/AcrR family transcriptional regulator [Burkholderia gladioli]KGC11711.1 bacterial regulatory s, tetR family protein [Burkholderia gladioli]MDJ1164172.1 helix-turn-helix domain-containing protein [Burkholderia gladioli pv. gladioli]QPQ84192.1 TetR/AcrR family transcriptional regulator [Burkholderia gladioli]